MHSNCSYDDNNASLSVINQIWIINKVIFINKYDVYCLTIENRQNNSIKGTNNFKGENQLIVVAYTI